jgi:hypothetical protein
MKFPHDEPLGPTGARLRNYNNLHFDEQGANRWTCHRYEATDASFIGALILDAKRLWHYQPNADLARGRLTLGEVRDITQMLTWLNLLEVVP